MALEIRGGHKELKGLDVRVRVRVGVKSKVARRRSVKIALMSTSSVTCVWNLWSED